MGIQLKEVMKIYPFSQARLVGGHLGVNRVVESANIQEVPDVGHWLKGGEIVFSAGYAFKNAEAGCTLIEQLNQLGVAALTIKPGKYLPKIPEEMVDRADQLGLPLFELPEDLPYMDCIIPIFERITEEQLWVLQRVESVHGQLMQVILQDEGLDGICNRLNSLTENPVFILAANGTPHAYCVGVGQPQEYQKEILEFFERYFDHKLVPHLRQNQCNTLHCAGDRTLICVPIVIHDEHIAYLVLDKQQDLVETDLIAFENASSLISIELLKERALVQKEQHMRGQILEDVLTKRYSDEKVILRRGRYVGFDFTRRFAVFVIDADSLEDNLQHELLDSGEEEIQKIKQKAQQTIRETMHAWTGSLLLMNDSFGMIGMAGIRDQSDWTRLRKAMRETVKRLKKEFPRLNFSAGVGRIKKGLTYADTSWSEARLALRAGRKRHGDDRTAAFDEMGVLCFLSELTESKAMRDYYDEHMRRLIEYDTQNKAELIKTLECYIASNGNLQATADMLFVHRNSVVYRLKKIKTIISANLTNYEELFNLQLCLKLKDIL